MEPRISKRDRRLHLTYELPHRIHCTQVCPFLALNGSTVIIYGHERGVRVLWRGGRRRRAAPRQANGISQMQGGSLIDDSDNERKHTNKQDGGDEYEDEEPEQDPDCPYSGVTHDLDIELESAALHVAIPSISTLRPPRLTTTHTLVVVACANGVLRLLCIPLAPPRDDEDSPSGLSQVQLPALRQPARSIAAKIVATDDEEHTQARSRSSGGSIEAEIIIAAASSRLDVFAVDMTTSAIRKRREPLVSRVSLTSPASKISFQPSSRSQQLLIGDAEGAVRIYDLYPDEAPSARAGGKWCMAYLAPYTVASASNPLLARRKKVLSCAWVQSGRGVLALLEDGEWGVWDTTGPTQSGKNVGDFAISGFLGATSEAAETGSSKKPSKLAPMTPNTRKTKSESLFSGHSKTAGSAASGGITVVTNTTKPGHADESVVLWYNGDIYSIPSMQQFWQRSTNNTGNLGSLYAPAMTHVSDVNLLNEQITSISQLPNGSQASNLGQMNTQRDLVVSAEHRMVITETSRPAGPARQLFQQAAERPASRDRDQRMLDAGDLDLGGLNRMLDSRAEDTRPRRVGFAH